MKDLLSGFIFTGLIVCSGFGKSTVASPETSCAVVVPDKPLAFPGAEGFGKYTTGGRGGEVVIVTNLHDDGPGSLREAIRIKEPRIIVFSVAGNIKLESSLDINYGNLTIAGQSAPGGGITIQNYPIKIKGDNVIIRYIRSRMGDEAQVQDDAISSLRNKNIIIDHCSFSWGTDESASFYDNENFTLQWSIISESLNNSVHEKGEHGYGGIWGGKGASFHHNLLAHHKSRLPRFNGARTHLKQQPEKEIVDFRNNVIYNWKINNAYAGERGNHNIVNNYYKPGPATEEDVKHRILDPWPPYGSFYVAGNYIEGVPQVTKRNKTGVSGDTPDSALSAAPVPVVRIQDQSAEDAFNMVLKYAGASFSRDEIDKRIAKDVRTGTAKFGKNNDGIIDSQAEVGGWPLLITGRAIKDTDKDGMEDEWEKENKLNPFSSGDASRYTVHTQYTNIEVYLNTLTDIGLSH